MRRRLRLLIALVVLTLAIDTRARGQADDPRAPDRFRVRLDTSKGAIVLQVTMAKLNVLDESNWVLCEKNDNAHLKNEECTLCELAALRARVQELEALCEDILHGPCANVTPKQYQAYLSKRAAELLKDAK